jgi:uncharacterized protein
MTALPAQVCSSPRPVGLARAPAGAAPAWGVPPGAGLGLRRAFLDQALEQPPGTVDFWEIAPENWIGVGGALGHKLRQLTERTAFVCHGLSLSLGGPAPLDHSLLDRLKAFLDEHGISYYTEHLSYCSDGGHLYDLMPIPFTEDAARYVAERIQRTQDHLGRRIGIENVSYYAAPGAELDEAEFINRVLAEADCDLHLDVNNVLVNSINHGYDAYEFLNRLPRDRVRYGHVAGHYVESPQLRIDTHGATVPEAVWQLAAFAFERFGPFPVAVERDFNIPPLAELLKEVARLRELINVHAASAAEARL